VAQILSIQAQAILGNFTVIMPTSVRIRPLP
jgi:hypothetical protein